MPAALLACLALAAAGQEPTEPATPPPAEEPILGAPAALEPQEFAGDREWLAAGTRLRREPDRAAPVFAVVDARVEVEVIERRGVWAQVRYASFKGWAYLGDDPRQDPAGLWLGPAAEPADPARLERARGLLPGGGRALDLAPFALYTDLADERLLAELRAVASGLEAAYAERLGLAPLPATGEAVILFSRDPEFRAFTEEETSLDRLDAHGHAGNGLAVLGAGEGSRAEVRRLLVHELVHLLNRRSLGAELPPWLEEGLAEELAYCKITAGGRLRLGTLDGEVSVADVPAGGLLASGARIRQVTAGGPTVALRRLAERLRKPGTPSLEELVALAWSDFVEPEGRDLLYAQSAFLVRYLLDGEGGRQSEAFRDYLATLVTGERPDPAGLAAHLGTSWEELQRGFDAWVREQAALTRALR